MEINCCSFSSLSTIQLYELLQLRSEVFVVEQDCVYQDIDGKDQKALAVRIALWDAIDKEINAKLVTY
jgi:ElaA protein